MNGNSTNTTPLPPTKSSNTKIFLLIIIIILAIGIVNSVASITEKNLSVAGMYQWIGEQIGFEFSGNTVINPEVVRVVDEQSAVIDVVEQNSAAVVSVLERSLTFSLFTGPQFVESSIGTGFAVENNMIITNKHVVNDSSAQYTVVDKEGERYDIEEIYRDPLNDLALLKVGGGNFSPVEMGDSDSIKVGQTVIAIGNALGRFDNTVTKGVVSGVGRGITASGSLGQYQEEIENVIQTDAALNPGNSGGPLLNIDGQVIGVNVAVGVDTENIGFAIPVNTAKDLISDFKAGIDRRKPFLGIRYVVITDEFARNSDFPEGVLVREVISGSAADNADIRLNDVIVEIGGNKINQENTLASIIGDFRVGDVVEIKVWRNGQEVELKAELQADNNQ